MRIASQRRAGGGPGRGRAHRAGALRVAATAAAVVSGGGTGTCGGREVLHLLPLGEAAASEARLGRTARRRAAGRAVGCLFCG